ncbi:hypothetical protein [Limimaricola pyoseonensis]|uniref:Uncharacterized protein n=1 Tax=Limimaricola pyoseonensis TaxID=521013 RepID=A0A1G7IHS8_9RHOB|nr:hypothetical protein [Limimaricola pyoseonensis]SDF12252.1 hypothetical protein SAMN04488567_3473 [Limimaricola pyoseonensis]
MAGGTSTYLQFPLHFAHPYNWPEELDPPSISYRRQPCSLTQRRFEGRDELIPQVDLNLFDAHAVLDWVQLKFFLTKKRQARNVARTVNDVLRAQGERGNAFVAGPNERTPYVGHEFYLRLQDPTPRTLALTLSAVRDKYLREEFAGTVFFIDAVEVSVDFYVKNPLDMEKSRCDLLRWQMVDLLRRHLRLPPDYTAQPRARPRVKFAEAQPVASLVNSRPPTWTKTLVDPILALDLPRRASTVFHPTAYSPPVIDGTYYAGPKEGPVLVRIMNKETNRRDNAAKTFDPLDDEAKRARLEVMIKNGHPGLGAFTVLHSIGEVGDLYDFEFQALRSGMFEFFLPTLRPELASLDLGLKGHISEVDAFEKGGVYALHRLHEGENELLRERRKHRMISEMPAKLRKHGFLRSFKALNHKIDHALIALARRWGREALLWELRDAGLSSAVTVETRPSGKSLAVRSTYSH